MYKTVEVEIDVSDVFDELTDDDLLEECDRRKLKAVAPIELADELARLQNLIMRSKRAESIALIDFIVTGFRSRMHNADADYNAAKKGTHSFLRVGS
jgi:hypothetical protein